MIKVKFSMLVFQEGQLDEEVETPTYSFSDWIKCAKAIVGFSAFNNNYRLNPALWAIESQQEIMPPSVKKGIGSETYLIINKVVPVE